MDAHCVAIHSNQMTKPTFDSAWLRNYNERRNYIKAGGKIPHPKPEQDQAPALGAAVSGKEKGVGRITGRIRVRFVLVRVRPLDPDAAAGSTKDLLDGLMHASLVPDDNPWNIRLEVEQVKVRHYAQESTIIEIETLQ